MPTCMFCGFEAERLVLPVPANDNRRQLVAANDNERIVIAAREEEVRSPEAVQGLAIPALNLGLSRRAFLDFLAERVFWFPGRIVHHNGGHFCRPARLFDDLFADGSARWVSDFFRAAERLPRQSAQWRVCKRLVVIRIALEIDGRDLSPR